MNMKLGTGRIWMSGMGDRSIPFYAPNYWQREELKGLVDANPLFEASSSSSMISSSPATKSCGKLWRKLLVPLVTALAFGWLALPSGNAIKRIPGPAARAVMVKQQRVCDEQAAGTVTAPPP